MDLGKSIINIIKPSRLLSATSSVCECDHLDQPSYYTLTTEEKARIILDDDERFRRLKEELRQSKMVTSIGVREILVRSIDKQIEEGDFYQTGSGSHSLLQCHHQDSCSFCTMSSISTNTSGTKKTSLDTASASLRTLSSTSTSTISSRSSMVSVSAKKGTSSKITSIFNLVTSNPPHNYSRQRSYDETSSKYIPNQQTRSMSLLSQSAHGQMSSKMSSSFNKSKSNSIPRTLSSGMLQTLQNFSDNLNLEGEILSHHAGKKNNSNNKKQSLFSRRRSSLDSVNEETSNNNKKNRSRRSTSVLV